MKFLCIGYFDPEKTAKRPKDEIGAVMASCAPFMEELLENKSVLAHAGLQVETRSIRRLGGAISVTDTPFAQGPERIGVSFIVNATDIDQAVDIASMHPAIQVKAGEDLGWGVEVRPIDSFQGAMS